MQILTYTQTLAYTYFITLYRAVNDYLRRMSAYLSEVMLSNIKEDTKTKKVR